jgi:RHS repeat-associated protein
VHRYTQATVNGTVTTYNRPATIYATLRKDTSQALEWTLTYRDLSVDSFDVAGAEGLLAKQADRFGNAVTFSYYAGSNRLYRATDPVGRYVEFSWNTGVSPARLSSFTDWAYVSGGVVQATQTGARRSYRLFYDAGGNLIGWANPLNTSGSCPTMASNLTCLAYSSNLLTAISKRQTIATLPGGAIGTTSRDVTTQVTYRGNEVAELRDPEQAFANATGTTFARIADRKLQVVRQGTPPVSLPSTTTYGHVASTDTLGRVESVWRKLDTTQIEQRTVWNSTYPTEATSVTDNYGALLGTPARTVSFTYVGSSMGLVSRMTEPLTATTNRTTDYTYNANNDITEMVVGLNGSSTVRTITRYCYTISTCSPSGAELTMRLRIENYVDGARGGTGGNVDDVTTEYLYATIGQITTGQLVRQTRYNYDAAGTLLDFNRTGYTYDAMGNVSSQIDHYSDGLVQDYWYDRNPHGTTGVRTDLTTAYTHDTAGNRISSADPRRPIAIENGQSLAADDYVARTQYDALNRATWQQVARDPADSAAPRTSTTAYDELGVVRQATDLGGLVSASEYDRAGRATRAFEDPDGAGGSNAFVTLQTTYDAAGRVWTTKDRRQLADSSLGYSEFTYDELGRQVSAIEARTSPAALATTSDFDALDRQVALTYGAGTATEQVTSYRYDLGGRVTEQDDEFTCTRTAYDYRDLALTVSEGLAAGNPCTGTALRTLTNTHDGLARLTRSEVTAGQGVGDIVAQDTFDSAGNRLSSASYVAATGTTTSATYTVNALDQTIAEVRSDGSVSRTIYDAVGNAAHRCYWATPPDDDCKPVGSSFTNPPTRHTTTTYDARNQRIQLVDAATNATTTYDPDHNYQLKAVYIPTATGKEHQSLYAYDGRHRLTGITHQLCTISSGHSCSSTTATGSDVYSYDVNDNRTQVTEFNGSPSPSPTPIPRYYCYDAQDRLVYRNSGAACSSSAKDESYTYDAAGNRLTAPGQTFTYNDAGQLTGCTSGCGSVTYDTAGRTRSWNNWWLGYDGEGRLTTACSASGCPTTSNRVLLTYDGEGRRTQIKTTPANGTPTDLDFRYQGSSIVEERTNGTVTRQYLVDEAGAIVKLVIPAGQANAGTYLVTWNGHGDALALHKIDPVNGTLTLANTYTYSTWGAPTTATHNSIPDLGFRFLYVGQFDVQWDNALGLGLHYMQARHYSPSIGRFLQPDPTRLDPNVYTYTDGSPVTRIDPSGTRFLDWERGGAGGGFGSGGKGIFRARTWLRNVNGTPRYVTPKGFEHSFGKHAPQWFGRRTTAADRAEWARMIDKGTDSNIIVNSRLYGQPTVAHLARFENKWFAVHYYTPGATQGAAWDFAGAFAISNAKAGFLRFFHRTGSLK